MIYIVKRTEGYWVAADSLHKAKEEYCDGRHCKECRLSWLNQKFGDPLLQCKQCDDEELIRRFGNDLRIVNNEEKPKNAPALENKFVTITMPKTDAEFLSDFVKECVPELLKEANTAAEICYKCDVVTKLMMIIDKIDKGGRGAE